MGSKNVAGLVLLHALAVIGLLAFLLGWFALSWEAQLQGTSLREIFRLAGASGTPLSAPRADLVRRLAELETLTAPVLLLLAAPWLLHLDRRESSLKSKVYARLQELGEKV